MGLCVKLYADLAALKSSCIVKITVLVVLVNIQVEKVVWHFDAESCRLVVVVLNCDF